MGRREPATSNHPVVTDRAVMKQSAAGRTVSYIIHDSWAEARRAPHLALRDSVQCRMDGAGCGVLQGLTGKHCDLILRQRHWLPCSS